MKDLLKYKQNFMKVFLKYKQYIIMVLVPLILDIIIEVFYKLNNIYSQKYPIISTHIIGFMIVCLFFFILLGILKSTFKATVTLSVLIFVILIVNQLKIVYSSNPIFLRDISFLKSPGTFLNIMEENVFDILGNLLFPIFILAVCLALLCFAVYKFNYIFEVKKTRIIFSVSSFAVLLIMLLPIKPINDIFINNFYKIDEEKNNNTVSNTKYYFQHGFLGGILGEYLTTMLREPENYNYDEMQHILDEMKTTENITAGIDDSNVNVVGEGKNWGKPNIIMVFSESFFDMSVVDEIEFDKDITPNLKELSKEGLLVNMISPTFGGISSNPEFEMLTGGSLKFFPENYIPYLNLYTSDIYKNSTSVIKELNNNGYDTQMMSWWEPGLFNSEKVYDYFDFKKVNFLTSVDLKYIKGIRISDDYVADKIIETFDNKKDNPLFYITLTAENHMPFTKGKYREYDLSIKSSSLTEQENDILLSYAEGVYHADQQLGKLYEYIQTLEEPTLLIFYGDHLPFLKNSEGDDVYDKLSYFNTGDELLDRYRKYNTQCIILDNFDAVHEDIEYLGYDLVMSYVLNNMDMELSPYYKWLYTTIYDLPAANKHVAVDKFGELYKTSELTSKMKETFDLREKMNWQMFVNIY